MTARRVGRREAAAQPEAIGVLPGDLREREPGQLVVGDAPGQGLGALAQQIRRSAAEHEKPRRAPGSVRQNPQARKEIRAPLDFVDDDEAAQRRQREQWIREPRQIGGGLEIEGVSWSLPAARDVASEGRLAHLTRPEEGDNRGA